MIDNVAKSSGEKKDDHFIQQNGCTQKKQENFRVNVIDFSI